MLDWVPLGTHHNAEHIIGVQSLVCGLIWEFEKLDPSNY